MGIANIAGRTDGYSDVEGFQLYGRVAQFADCKKFKPPGRTRLLCQTTPPAQRAGPTFQLFSSDLPLNQKAFNLHLPRDSALLGRFGQQAILHQPGAYLSAIFEEYACEERGIAQRLAHRAALGDDSGKIVLARHAVAECRAQAMSAEAFDFCYFNHRRGSADSVPVVMRGLDPRIHVF